MHWFNFRGSFALQWYLSLGMLLFTFRNVNKDLIVKCRHAIDLLFLSMFLCECQPQQYKRWGIGLQCIYTTKRSFEPTCMNRSLYYVTAVLDEDLSTDNDCENKYNNMSRIPSELHKLSNVNTSIVTLGFR